MNGYVIKWPGYITTDARARRKEVLDDLDQQVPPERLRQLREFLIFQIQYLELLAFLFQSTAHFRMNLKTELKAVGRLPLSQLISTTA